MASACASSFVETCDVSSSDQLRLFLSHRSSWYFLVSAAADCCVKMSKIWRLVFLCLCLVGALAKTNYADVRAKVAQVGCMRARGRRHKLGG